MILLDTNVLSEFTNIRPNQAVTAWFEGQDIGELWTTAITETELLIGLAKMSEGRRKTELQIAIDAMLGLFEHRILPFDRDAAHRMPDVFLERRRANLEAKLADSQIAAIALAQGAAVATRDMADFSHTGVKIINPWTA
jgi:predicted nucleic acid-binding protein